MMCRFFLLLIKEVLQRVQSEYDTIQTEPINIHLPSLLLVFLFIVDSFSFFSAVFSCVFETEIRAGWEKQQISKTLNHVRFSHTGSEES